MENVDIIIESTIDGPVGTWRLPPTDGDLGGTYTGTFKFRCFLDPIKKLEAGREYREMLGKHAVLAEQSEIDLAFALTQCKQRIVSAPPFWNETIPMSGIAGNLKDLNIIVLVLDAAIRAENLYEEKINKEKQDLLDRSIKAAEQIVKKRAEEQKAE